MLGSVIGYLVQAMGGECFTAGGLALTRALAEVLVREGPGRWPCGMWTRS